MNAKCLGCGLPYYDKAAWPMDTVLPDADWMAINPDGPGGVLCPACIASRAASVPEIVLLYARLVRVSDHAAFRALKNVPLNTLARMEQELTEKTRMLIDVEQELTTARDAVRGCVALFEAWRDGIFQRSGITWIEEPPAIQQARRVAADRTEGE